MLTCIVAVFVAVFVMVGSGAAEAKKLPRQKCLTNGPRIVATSGRVSVYTLRQQPPSPPIYLGCDRRTGRVSQLNIYGDGGRNQGIDEIVSTVAVTGRFVALGVGVSGTGFQQKVRVADLSRRHPYSAGSDFDQYVGQPDDLSRAFDAPIGLTVTTTGDVGWISRRPDDDLLEVLYAREGAQPQLLDQGSDVVADSLAVGKRYVYWQRSGPHVAPR